MQTQLSWHEAATCGEAMIVAGMEERGIVSNPSPAKKLSAASVNKYARRAPWLRARSTNIEINAAPIPPER